MRGKDFLTERNKLVVLEIYSRILVVQVMQHKILVVQKTQCDIFIAQETSHKMLMV